jgi:hypothetical protein
MDQVALTWSSLCNDCLETMSYLYLSLYIYALSLNAIHSKLNLFFSENHNVRSGVDPGVFKPPIVAFLPKLIFSLRFDRWLPLQNFFLW